METGSKIHPALHTAMMFRYLFGTQDDRFEPDYACYIVRAIQSLDDESAAVTITLAINSARWSNHPARLS